MAHVQCRDPSTSICHAVPCELAKVERFHIRSALRTVGFTNFSLIVCVVVWLLQEPEQPAPQRTARDLTKDVKLIAYIIALHGTSTNSAVYAKLRQLLLARTPLSKAAYVTAVFAVIAVAVRRAHRLKAAAKLYAVYGLQYGH
jgi:hypothetical protein